MPKNYWTGYFGNPCYYPEGLPSKEAMEAADAVPANVAVPAFKGRKKKFSAGLASAKVATGGYYERFAAASGLGNYYEPTGAAKLSIKTATTATRGGTPSGVYSGGVVGIGIQGGSGGGGYIPPKTTIFTQPTKPSGSFGLATSTSGKGGSSIITNTKGSFGLTKSNPIFGVPVKPVSTTKPGVKPPGFIAARPKTVSPATPAESLPTTNVVTGGGGGGGSGGGGGGGGSPFDDEELPTVGEPVASDKKWLYIGGAAVAAYFLFLRKK
jgi:hypothetical protein